MAFPPLNILCADKKLCAGITHYSMQITELLQETSVHIQPGATAAECTLKQKQ